MKLISMTSFISEIEDYVHESHNKERGFDLIKSYAEFLKQPLTLGMFVPVDSHGVILEDLQFCCSSPDCGCMGMPVNVSSMDEIDEYYEAKDRVLFKGFKLMDVGLVGTVINNDGERFYLGGNYNHTIEHKINHNLELTDSAIKQIGL